LVDERWVYEGGVTMVERNMEEKGYTHTGRVVQNCENVKVCPVCGKELCSQLPCRESILGDSLVLTEYICIVNSEITVECRFYHERDEADEDTFLEEPHKLIAVIRMAFDSSGVCMVFDIVDIRVSDSPVELNSIDSAVVT
jgi:hypothetical protein